MPTVISGPGTNSSIMQSPNSLNVFCAAEIASCGAETMLIPTLLPCFIGLTTYLPAKSRNCCSSESTSVAGSNSTAAGAATPASSKSCLLAILSNASSLARESLPV
jgi:hypothetical protein